MLSKSFDFGLRKLCAFTVLTGIDNEFTQLFGSSDCNIRCVIVLHGRRTKINYTETVRTCHKLTGSGGTSSSVFVSHNCVDDCNSVSCCSAAAAPTLGSVKATAKSAMKINRFEIVWCRVVVSDEGNEKSWGLRRTAITVLFLSSLPLHLTSATTNKTKRSNNNISQLNTAVIHHIFLLIGKLCLKWVKVEAIRKGVSTNESFPVLWGELSNLIICYEKLCAGKSFHWMIQTILLINQLSLAEILHCD